MHFIGVFAVHTQRPDATLFYDVLIGIVLTVNLFQLFNGLFSGGGGSVVKLCIIPLLNVAWNVLGLGAINVYLSHLKLIEFQYEMQP